MVRCLRATSHWPSSWPTSQPIEQGLISDLLDAEEWDPQTRHDATTDDSTLSTTWPSGRCGRVHGKKTSVVQPSPRHRRDP